ncbi:MAG: PEP-CTERM sorting domain-containing protein [Oceanipulchritudo sp.]
MKCGKLTTTILGHILFAGMVLTSASGAVFNSLDWLPVTSSINISFDAIQSEFGAGGAYEGYRHATLQETTDLATGFGYSFSATPEENSAAIEDLHSFLGTTAFRTLPYYQFSTLGYTADGTRFDIRLVMIDVNTPATWQGDVYETNYGFFDLSNAEIGHYLVQSVPEPAQLALLMGVGSLLLVLHRKRR